MKLTAIAIDDEPVALAVIQNHAAMVPFLEMKGFFANAFEALDFLSKEKVDLLFLDIKMPDISGLDFLSSLPQPPMTIFTTAYSEHAVKSFELDAIDYLLKPFSLIRFVKACNKANSLLQLKLNGGGTLREVPEYIFVKSGYEQFKVVLEDILYLESAGNYVNFILTDRKLISRLSMQEATDLLPASFFTRVHRSYIVANNKIERADRNALYIRNIPIPIGAAYAPAVEKLF
ncbi:LytR/AlgR family response regulator transcription factor [Chitinophaga nivalis]|uniref:LytTR family DNA-binding domain-containing protein n=1 Tax=Chitinophaga nivalis TaxID=2991709 RepID=A0ABT3IRB5_9BACT|nr:LytTR family DNA-binding domain-containing protein [Chitinophaga nivalis]MCW3463789.1 LytTR family DNA-binding domain-containing protein [Chitinophaga nivalis]MCW3486521.1 LytTR family DNA-binding domain-containing protein [Chitinophaga nivalis]